MLLVGFDLCSWIDWTGLTFLDDADIDARALDEYVSQEEAMEMAMRETMQQQNGSFDDDEYDDIFLTMDSAMGQSQDMDMS